MSMKYGESERRAPDAPGRLQRYFSSIDPETGEEIMEQSMTKQEFADDADINKIVANIMKTGVSDWLDNHNDWVKNAGDVEVPNIDYKGMMDILADAEDRFMDLPSQVRAGFDNDPAVFMDWVQGEGGDVELQELIAKAAPKIVKKGSAHEGSRPKEPDGDGNGHPKPSGEE